MSTPQLNAREQQAVDRLAKLEEAKRNGASIHKSQLERAQFNAQVARGNAAARVKLDAQIAANVTELEQRDAAAQAERTAQVRADFKQQARDAFFGTDAEFEAAWPDLLRKWQIDQAVARLQPPTEGDPAVNDYIRATYR